MFLHWYFVRFAGRSPFGFSGALDIKTMYHQKAGVTFDRAGRRDLPAILAPQMPHTHNALDDAREQAEIFARSSRGTANQNDHGDPVRPRRHARRRGAGRGGRVSGDGARGGPPVRGRPGRPRAHGAYPGPRVVARRAGVRLRGGHDRDELLGGAVVPLGGRRRRGAGVPGVGRGLPHACLAHRARRPRHRRPGAGRAARGAIRYRAPPPARGVRRRPPGARGTCAARTRWRSSPTARRASSARSWPEAGSPRPTSTRS